MTGASTHGAGRSAPLALLAGEREVILLPDDVRTLLAGIDRLVDGVSQSLNGNVRSGVPLRALDDVQALREVFGSSTARLTDPPVEVTRDTARVLRQVMADISGYQRAELTRGLRELQVALDAAFAA